MVNTWSDCAGTGVDMSTLQQKIASLTPERRAKVLHRTQELVAEEMARRAAEKAGGPTRGASESQPSHDPMDVAQETV